MGENTFMRIRSVAGAYAAAIVLTSVCLTLRAQGRPPIARTSVQDDGVQPAVTLKPEVAALLRQSTSVYSAMRSYRHISEYNLKGQGPQGEVNHTTTYTLALERPNKFCYKSDEANGIAAVSDGKTFVNYFGKKTDEAPHSYYTRISAPSAYKGINIVDDVTFVFGSYFVALMLQGNVLADQEVGAALEGATLRASVEENGKKYDILAVKFVERSAPGVFVQGPPAQLAVLFYFDAATHLLRKTVETSSQDHVKITEIIENVLIDKSIPAGTFEVKLPKSARLIVGLPIRAKRGVALAAAFAPPVLNVGHLLENADACFGPSF